MVPEISLLLILIEDLGFYWSSTNIKRKGGPTAPLAPSLNPPLGNLSTTQDDATFLKSEGLESNLADVLL